MATSEEGKRVIARSTAGTADEEELDKAIADAWRDALANPNERAKIAVLLDAKESELDPSIPPFEVYVSGAGTFGADILIALAVAFAIGAAKGFGEEEGETAGKAAAKALNRLWIEHIRNRVSPPNSGILGSEKDEDNSG